MKKWTKIEGYDNYEISNFGNVISRSKKWKTGNPLMLKLGDSLGYKSVFLYKDGIPKRILIHRLVASCFLSNPFGKKEVNHIDGNRENNTVENLEWCTAKENQIHSFANGIRKFKLIPKQIRIIKHAIAIGVKGKILSDIFKVSMKTIQQIKNGEIWDYVLI